MKPLFDSLPPPDLPLHLRWRCIKVPPGTHGPYMVAGPGWSGTGHYSGKRTMPCAAKLPGCRLECPLCRRAQRFVCYLPVFSLRATKQPQLVIQGAKRSHATFCTFKFGDIVSVVRGNADRDTPLFVGSKHSEPTVDTDKFRKRGPQDITRYLLHLWQWRELSESYGEVFYPSSRSLEIEAGLRSIEDDPPRSAESE
jgi:hypothetical protein